jgi:DNA-binding NarL/FixJ family response regulator
MIITSTTEQKNPNYHPIKLALIQHDILQRKLFKRLLESLQRFQEIRSYSTCEELIKLSDSEWPDVIVIDPESHFIGLIESFRKVKRQLPSANIVMVIDDESNFVFDALNSGVCGFIRRGSTKDEILNAVVEAANGGAPLTSKIARMVVESFQKNLETPLTARETEVMELLSRGKSYSIIADELFIHKETVKSHIKNIYVKLKVKSKAEAIDRAMKDRLI